MAENGIKLLVSLKSPSIAHIRQKFLLFNHSLHIC